MPSAGTPLRPEETASALAFAVVLVEGNHWGEAKPLLEKVLSQSPNDKGAQLAMGVVQYNAGDLAAAKKYLTAALGGPDDGNAHYFLGLIAKQQGDFSEAIAEMEQSVAIQRHNPKAFGQLGQLYLQQNDLPKARAALEKAIEQAPDEPQNHYELARVYNKLGSEGRSRRATQALPEAASATAAVAAGRSSSRGLVTSKITQKRPRSTVAMQDISQIMFDIDCL